jgi:hypothetical protein
MDRGALLINAAERISFSRQSFPLSGTLFTQGLLWCCCGVAVALTGG